MSGDNEIRALVGEETRWITSDGVAHSTEKEAFDHQEAVYFTEWCMKNICVGGEWTSEQVANAILEEWMVRPR